LCHKLDRIAGKVFLDVACGTGRWMAHAVAQGARAIGVDLTFEMLAVARGKPQLAGFLVQADGHRLPFPDRCADMVMCSFSLGYVGSPDGLIHELSRVARRGGTVLVSDFHPRGHEAGWRRSFRSEAKVFEIESCPHTSDQLVSSGRSAGLQLKEILEPHLSEPERLIMQGAGKMELFDEVSAVPAVLAVEWER
jgi:ubiquinone/menaquinone biosynthesis C-methylase UbiE